MLACHLYICSPRGQPFLHLKKRWSIYLMSFKFFIDRNLLLGMFYKYFFSSLWLLCIQKFQREIFDFYAT